MLLRRKKYIFIGSFILILVVLIVSITIYWGNRNKEWDITLYRGLVRESLALDDGLKKELGDIIQNMELNPIKDTLSNSLLVGGRHYEVLFTKNGITNQWILTENVTHQKILKNGVLIEDNYFEKDKGTLYSIDNLIYYKLKKSKYIISKTRNPDHIKVNVIKSPKIRCPI